MDIESLVAQYAYRSHYSPEDGQYIAKCAEFPRLEAMASERADALVSLKLLVHQEIESQLKEGIKPPVAVSKRTYTGELTLELTAEQYQDLAIKAARAGMQVEEYVVSRL